MKWPIVKLGEVTERVDYGLTASAKDDNDGPRFLRITDMQDDSVNWSTVPSCDCTKKEFEDNQLSLGDIVFARTGATTGKSYLISALPSPAVFASYLIRVRPNSLVDSRYLSYFFRSPMYWHQISTMANGAAQPGVNSSKLRELQIPLPPLAEQKRIASILDKADAIRRKRQQAIDLADEFLRAVFIDMFGDPVTNSKGWRVVPLIELCQKITDGTHQSPKWEDSGVPFLFISNIVNGKISFDTNKFISKETLNELTRSTPIEKDDILYTTVGSYGNVALIPDDKEFCFQRHIAHIKPNHDLVKAEFLAGMLSSSVIRRQADGLVRGVAQKTLNLRELKEIKVFDVSLEDQKKYIDIVEPLRRAKENYEQSFSELIKNFNSLSQKAFLSEF